MSVLAVAMLMTAAGEVQRQQTPRTPPPLVVAPAPIPNVMRPPPMPCEPSSGSAVPQNAHSAMIRPICQCERPQPGQYLVS